jgi:periplasmic protein TonB
MEAALHRRPGTPLWARLESSDRNTLPLPRAAALALLAEAAAFGVVAALASILRPPAPPQEPPPMRVIPVVLTEPAPPTPESIAELKPEPKLEPLPEPKVEPPPAETKKIHKKPRPKLLARAAPASKPVPEPPPAPAETAPSPELTAPPAAAVPQVAPPPAAPMGAVRHNIGCSGKQPDYPARARREGIEGRVKAHLSIDEKGVVTRVEIIDANPRHIFDNAVTSALEHYRCESIGTAYVGEISITFHLE